VSCRVVSCRVVSCRVVSCRVAAILGLFESSLKKSSAFEIAPLSYMPISCCEISIACRFSLFVPALSNGLLLSRMHSPSVPALSASGLFGGSSPASQLSSLCGPFVRTSATGSRRASRTHQGLCPAGTVPEGQTLHDSQKAEFCPGTGWARFGHRVGTSFNPSPKSKKAQAPRCLSLFAFVWLRGQDLNLRPSGYEPDELPDCSTPRQRKNILEDCKTRVKIYFAARQNTGPPPESKKPKHRSDWAFCFIGLRGQDLNLRPSGYEPDELPDCSTPRQRDRILASYPENAKLFLIMGSGILRPGRTPSLPTLKTGSQSQAVPAADRHARQADPPLPA
jgi:hypothetical protein